MARSEIPNLNNLTDLVYPYLAGHAAYFNPSPTIELMLRQPKADAVVFKDLIVNKLTGFGFTVLDRTYGSSTYVNTNVEFDWVWVKVALDGRVDVVYVDNRIQTAYLSKSVVAGNFKFPDYLDSTISGLKGHFETDTNSYVSVMKTQMVSLSKLNYLIYMVDVDDTNISGLLTRLRDIPIRFGSYGNDQEHMVKLVFPYVSHYNEFVSRSSSLLASKRNPDGDLSFKPK